MKAWARVQGALWRIGAPAGSAQLAPGDGLDTVVLRLPAVTLRLCPASLTLRAAAAAEVTASADGVPSSSRRKAAERTMAVAVTARGGALTVEQVLHAVAALAQQSGLPCGASAAEGRSQAGRRGAEEGLQVGHSVVLDGLRKASPGGRTPVVYDVTFIL